MCNDIEEVETESESYHDEKTLEIPGLTEIDSIEDTESFHEFSRKSSKRALITPKIEVRDGVNHDEENIRKIQVIL